MNDVLSFKRLFFLLHKHWLENSKSYGLFILAVAIFLIGWFSFFLVIGQPHLFDAGTQLTIYFTGLFIGGCLSASFLFQDLSSRPRKVSYLLLPASALEKLLCVLFYGVMVFFVGYSLVFYITDVVAVKMAGNIFTVAWQKKHDFNELFYSFKAINVFSLNADMFVFYPGDNIDLFSAYFPIQAAFILGAVYFKHNSLFKTIVALLAVWMLFVILESKIFSGTMPMDVKSFNAFTAYSAPGVDGNEKIVALPFWISRWVVFMARYILTPTLYAATYFRLKEKEI